MPSWWSSYLSLLGQNTSWLKLGTSFFSSCMFSFFPQDKMWTDVWLQLMLDIFIVAVFSSGLNWILLEKATNDAKTVMLSLASLCISCVPRWNRRDGCCFPDELCPLWVQTSNISSTVSHPQPDTKSVCLSSHVSCLGGLWQARKTTSVFIWDETRQ